MGAVGALSALLEDPGTEVDVMDDVGETPLHLAAAAGRTLAVQRLLEHGARVDPPSHHGYTPLHMAAQHGHLATAELLLQALTLSPISNPNPSPLPLDTTLLALLRKSAQMQSNSRWETLCSVSTGALLKAT